MNKNDIYLGVLRLSLPHIRNGSTRGVLARLKDKSVYFGLSGQNGEFIAWEDSWLIPLVLSGKGSFVATPRHAIK